MADFLEGVPEGLRGELLRDLGLLDGVFESNPLARWFPLVSPVDGREPQRLFLESGAKLRAYFGGNQTGKTTVGVVDDLVQCLDRSAVPPHLLPFKRFEPPVFLRVVTPGAGTTLETAVLQKFRELCPLGELQGGSWDSGFKTQLRMLRFGNGSWIQFVTHEMDVDKLGGAKLHRVHYDEEPPEGLRNECRVRLVALGGDEVFTMTPQSGMTWVFDKVWERRGEPGVFCVRSSMFDNPTLGRDEIGRVVGDVSEDERRSRVEGEFAAFEGQVFKEFDVGRHVVPGLVLDDLGGLDVVVGIDPGVRFFAVVWCAFDSSNRLTVFDELKVGDWTVPQVAAEIRRRNELWGVVDPEFVIDPAARNRSAAYGDSIEGAFHREGVFAAWGQNDVDAGVLELKRRFTHDALFVCGGCVEWLRERERYVWVQTPDGGFKPRKRDDHLLDATRYVAMHRRWVGGGESFVSGRPLVPSFGPMGPLS